MSNEVRIDEIENRYVIIAPHRAKRPHDFKVKKRVNKGKKSQFYPDNIPEEQIIETFGRNPWKIAVLHNKFPAVTLDSKQARGKQEVVVETPDPGKDFYDLPVSHIKQVLDVYAHRTEEISHIPNIDYVLVFKNKGPEAGASIAHAHSQIWATEKPSRQLLHTSDRLEAYKKKTDRSYYRDLILQEIRGPRLVYKDEHVIAFTPYASIFNHEVWILTRKQRDNIRELTDDERTALAKLLKKLLKKVVKLGLDYNFYFHEIFSKKNQHFVLKIAPRAAIWAGVEVGTGMIINPTSPEEAAKYYRGR